MHIVDLLIDACELGVAQVADTRIHRCGADTPGLQLLPRGLLVEKPAQLVFGRSGLRRTDDLLGTDHCRLRGHDRQNRQHDRQ